MPLYSFIFFSNVVVSIRKKEREIKGDEYSDEIFLTLIK